jgi:hypothetical protein
MRITAAFVAYVLDVKTLKLWSANMMHDACVYKNAHLRACFTQNLRQIGRKCHLKACREVKLGRCTLAEGRKTHLRKQSVTDTGSLNCSAGGRPSRVR